MPNKLLDSPPEQFKDLYELPKLDYVTLGNFNMLITLDALAQELRMTPEDMLAFLNRIHLPTFKFKESKTGADGLWLNLWALILSIWCFSFYGRWAPECTHEELQEAIQQAGESGRAIKTSSREEVKARLAFLGAALLTSLNEYATRGSKGWAGEKAIGKARKQYAGTIDRLRNSLEVCRRRIGHLEKAVGITCKGEPTRGKI